MEGDGVAVLALGVLPSCAAQLALTFRGCSPLSCLRAGRSYVDYVARGSVRTPVTPRTSLEADQLQGVVQNIINLSAASCVAFLCSAAGLLPPVPLRKRYGAVDRGGDSDNNRRRSVERVYLVPNLLRHAFVLNFLETSAVDVPSRSVPPHSVESSSGQISATQCNSVQLSVVSLQHVCFRALLPGTPRVSPPPGRRRITIAHVHCTLLSDLYM